MKCEILTIGTELTLGLTIDSNSTRIAYRLAEIGIVSDRKSSVAGDVNLISRAIKDAFLRSDVLIITGGLGSTHDDLAREAIAKALSRKLVFQPMLAASIEQKYKGLELAVPSAVVKQAYLPEGAEPIKPFHGIAPGIIIRHNKHVIFMLPGMPSEMEWMLEAAVIPLLAKKIGQRKNVLLKRIKTCGEGELVIEKKIKGVLERYPDISVSILPYPGEVHLQLATKAPTKDTEILIDKVVDELRNILGATVFGFDSDTLEGVTGELLKKHDLKIAVVESCTGGALANLITSVPGSSSYFWGAIVSYSNEMKRRVVSVSGEDILKYGAVSAPVALSMAEGGRHVAQVDIALGVTGIAGPTGETKDKAVGLVFIGLAWREGSYCERFQLSGTREEIKTRASKAALNMLRLFLLEKFEDTGSEVS